MTIGFYTRSIAITGLVLLASAWLLNAEPTKRPEAQDKAARATVEEARIQAKMMHDIYAQTLLVMHRHYFRREGSVLPARALEDVFAGIDEQSKIKARWIAVNTPPMSINHKAVGDFEEKAVVQIADGKAEYERVEGGYYKRAGVIPLGVGCVGCHTKLFQTPAKTPRFAGLVIEIPVKEKKSHE